MKSTQISERLISALVGITATIASLALLRPYFITSPEMHDLDLTSRKLERLNVEFSDVKENVSRLTSEEVERKLRESEAKISALSAQLESLQQIISPNNANEILTVARMK